MAEPGRWFKPDVPPEFTHDEDGTPFPPLRIEMMNNVPNESAEVRIRRLVRSDLKLARCVTRVVISQSDEYNAWHFGGRKGNPNPDWRKHATYQMYDADGKEVLGKQHVWEDGYGSMHPRNKWQTPASREVSAIMGRPLKPFERPSPAQLAATQAAGGQPRTQAAPSARANLPGNGRNNFGRKGPLPQHQQQAPGRSNTGAPGPLLSPMPPTQQFSGLGLGPSSGFGRPNPMLAAGNGGFSNYAPQVPANGRVSVSVMPYVPPHRSNQDFASVDPRAPPMLDAWRDRLPPAHPLGQNRAAPTARTAGLGQNHGANFGRQGGHGRGSAGFGPARPQSNLGVAPTIPPTHTNNPGIAAFNARWRGMNGVPNNTQADSGDETDARNRPAAAQQSRSEYISNLKSWRQPPADKK